jgi:hypothetical protein
VKISDLKTVNLTMKKLENALKHPMYRPLNTILGRYVRGKSDLKTVNLTMKRLGNALKHPIHQTLNLGLERMYLNGNLKW